MTESTDNKSDMSISDDDIIDHSENLNLAGCILNKYNILTELGRGMYSIVWLAFCIENKKYYAIKVQHPNEYKDGVNENAFVKLLPNISVLNTIIHDFKEIRNNQKYLCTVYNLHCSNLDCILRKGKYNNGIPFNIASSALLTYMIATVTGTKPSRLMICIGDAHIYTSHIDQIKLQMQREPFPSPKIIIKADPTNIIDYIKYEDIELIEYQSHEKLSSPMIA